MKFLSTCLLLVLVAVHTPLAAEEDELRELGWQDLAPEVEAIENPFEELSIEQIRNFRLYLRHLQIPEVDHTQEQQESQKEIRALLEADGLKPDEMVVQYETLLEKYREAQTATRPDILDQDIKIPGYLLPLDVKEGAVTRFLLVPTVGACIHAPTPPPNQMVYIHYEDGFEGATMFQPVWVSGKLKADNRTENLSLVDGASDVNVAYAMDAESVWLYQ